MENEKTTAVTVGTAQRAGTEPPRADGTARAPDGRPGAARPSLTGPAITRRWSTLRSTAPSVIALMGMAMGGLVGLTTAGADDNYAYDPPPHMSAVYASAEAGPPHGHPLDRGTAGRTDGHGTELEAVQHAPDHGPSGRGGTGAFPWRSRRPRTTGHGSVLRRLTGDDVPAGRDPPGRPCGRRS